MALKLVLTIEGDNAAEMANVLNAIAGTPSTTVIPLGADKPKKEKAKEKIADAAPQGQGEEETKEDTATRSESGLHMDDIRSAASEKIKKNKPAVMELVQSYGVKTVSLLPEAKWPEFMEKLKAI